MLFKTPVNNIVVFPLILPGEGRTNIELRDQLSRPEGATQSMASFKSRRPTASSEGSDLSRPPIARERSGGSLHRGVASKPPTGSRLKPRLDVQSSGYGISRESSSDGRTFSSRGSSSTMKSASSRVAKSGLMKPSSTRGSRESLRSSAENLKGSRDGLHSTGSASVSPRRPAAKNGTSGVAEKKPSASTVKRTDSQTSIGSSGSVEDSSEGRASSQRTTSSRTLKTTSSRVAKSGLLKPSSTRGSRESLKGSAESLKGSRDGLHSTGSASGAARKPASKTGTKPEGHAKSTSSSSAHPTKKKTEEKK